MPTRPDDAVFDESLVEAAAAANDVDPSELAALIYRHQTSVAALPGVEELVYEWRKHFDDPLLARTERAYYLAVPDTVWDEFAAHLDVRDAARDALVDVHRRTAASHLDVAPDPPAGDAYVVFDRRVTAD